MPTPLQALLTHKLGDLDRFVGSRRARGKSWQDIAWEIRQTTEVEISDETLRSWFIDKAAS